MKKPIVFSGIQPTGNLHLGNYLGAVKNWIALQESEKYDCYFCIVDYHSLTGKMTAAERREKTLNVAAELLASGIDPDKCTFFVQSHVPEHTELGWIFNSVTPLGELKRMTQFKDKAGIGAVSEEVVKQFFSSFEEMNATDLLKIILNDPEKKNAFLVKHLIPILDKAEEFKMANATSGLLTYPILQAADILLYHGELVPVGQDQIQHIELTRDIARWFNARYGAYFPETKHLLTEVPKVMSLLEPTKKMSKSLGAGHVIELCEEPAEIEAKLKRAVTATEGGGTAPGVENLLLLLKQFSDTETYSHFAAAEKDKTIRYGELKSTLGKAIADHFTTFRSRRAELLNNPSQLEKILANGAQKARTHAEATMKEVRNLIGIR